MEAHGTTIDAKVDKTKQNLKLTFDRAHVLREAILACRKGGTVSLAGVYGGFVDKVPMGAAMNKGLTFKMGQTHMHRYMKPLLEKVEKGEIDLARVITHRLNLDDAPGAYKTFRDKQEGCIKVVLKPNGNGHFHAYGGNGHSHSHGGNGHGNEQAH
jgi:threonine dehydrogenase-like Zn-dependent dehydrogenase